MLFITILFIVLVGGGWLVGKAVGNILFGSSEKKETYVDKTTHIHNHYHDNRSVHVDGKEFKNLKK